MRKSIMLYWQSNIPEKKYALVDVDMIINKKLLNFYLWTRRFPIEMTKKASNLLSMDKTVK